MNQYELGVIVRADLEEETLQKEMTTIKGLIERFGGTIDKIDEWGRRRLAYPIQKLNDGVYTFITYTSESHAPREIEARLRLMESVLRFLTINKNESASAQSVEIPSEPTAAPAAEPVAEPLAAVVEEPVQEAEVQNPAEE